MTTGNINKYHDAEYEVVVHWEIPNFMSHLKGTVSIQSPSFNWSTISWNLQMKYDTENDVSLYVYQITSGTQIPLTYKFGVLLIDETTEIRSSFIRDINDSSTGWVTYRVISKSELEQRKLELLPAGIFTISCSLTHKDVLIKPENTKYERFDVLSSNLEALYGCRNTSDITIVVGEQEYPAHKAILAARSQVFAAMFQHDMKEVKTGIINVDDCDQDSFKDFLLYLYAGKVDNFSSDNVCHLYKTADKYNVEELKNLCVRYMKRNISVENLFNIITLAYQFDKTDMISLAQEFFNRNAQEIIKGDGWKELMKQNFSLANQLLIKMLDKVKYVE